MAAEFWALSPRQLVELVRRRRTAERVRDYRAGTIAAVVAETRRDGKKRPKPYTWLDFFPQHRSRQAWQDQLAIVEMLNAIFGGRDLRQKGAAG